MVVPGPVATLASLCLSPSLGDLMIKIKAAAQRPGPCAYAIATKRGANLKRPQPHAVAPAPTRQPTRHG